MLQIGEKIHFGAYPTDEDGTRKDLIWRVLYEENGKYLLLTDKIIDARPFHGKQFDPIPSSLNFDTRRMGYVRYWTECELRQWLNTEFISTAFTEDEMEHIVPVKVADQFSTGTFFWEKGKNVVEDRIFLLCAQDFKFHEYGLYVDIGEKADVPRLPSHDPKAEFTPYAKKALLAGNPKPLHTDFTGGYGYWWLRNEDSGDIIACITDLGSVFGSNMENILGVRPVLWYSPDKDMKLERIM